VLGQKIAALSQQISENLKGSWDKIAGTVQLLQLGLPNRHCTPRTAT
jgi:hypothetical protein